MSGDLDDLPGTPPGASVDTMELHDLTALEQGDAVRRGEVSPVELVEHYAARADRVGAFVTTSHEHARHSATIAGAVVVEGIVVDEPALEGDPLANEEAVRRFLGALDALVAHEVEVAA